MIVVLDNQDSFVYNLVSQFEELGHEVRVMRNTVRADDVLEANPDLVCLSPGPGAPADAGCLLELTARCVGNVPVLGICLGFQALIEVAGGRVGPVGAVHGKSQELQLTAAGMRDPVFRSCQGQPIELSVARYHSLGTRTLPDSLTPLATIDGIVMAARWDNQPAVGLQFHPESVLTLRGMEMMRDTLESLLGAGGTPADSGTAPGAGGTPADSGTASRTSAPPSTETPNRATVAKPLRNQS
ncbi:MAG: gamma-glutamyl-gamma-aminobutyrate hydrolase family protein [Actinomycetaceae bacterium]|nr:gamma-glutamyl-gamma-aminobutyrate hydrolase family protein [Actinomycetaceae bacterium]